MDSMKLTRIAALVGLMAFAAPAAYAQGGGGGGGQGRGRQMEMLMQGITLTDAQKASVDSIGQVYRAQMPPMQQGTPPDSATRAKRMEVMQKQVTAGARRAHPRAAEGLRQEPRGHARQHGAPEALTAARSALTVRHRDPSSALRQTRGRSFSAA
jgi:hypothetical protein